MKKILTGCCCIIGLVATSQSSNIFKGGNGDGFNRLTYTQNTANIWTGGSGDGYSRSSYAQNSASFWRGSNGDGHSKAGYLQASTSFWTGGDGDGYTKNNYVQASTSFWLGGNGDGHSDTGYTQGSVSFWKGGIGDGWASVYKPQGPLPLTWLSFEAEKFVGRYSRLTWKTASESNTSHFEIERGTDAVNFVKIASVKASGNSITPKQYVLDDVTPAKGFNYYRIKQIDLNGRFSYSPARLVRFDAATENVIRIYPVPAKDFINVEIPEAMRRENTIINIVALNGAVVEHLKVTAGGNSFIRVNVARLARSAYTIHVSSASSTYATRIVLQ